MVTSTASTFGQRVAYEIFGEAGALSEQSAWYRTQRTRVIAALDASGFGVRPDRRRVLCLRTATTRQRLPRRPRSSSSSIATSSRSPAASSADSLEGWLRLSWVAPLDQFEEGLRRIAAL